MSSSEYTGRDEGNTNSVTREYAVASGVTVNDGDFVYLDSNGRISNASITGKRLLGTVVGGATGAALATNRTYTPASTGDAGGTVTVLVNIERDARYLLKNDNVGTTFAVTHVGKYFDLTGATNAQLVDTSTASATTGQLYCVSFNPGIRGTDATYGLFRLAEKQETDDDIGAS